MIVLGADTHKRSHTIAAVSAATGEVAGEQTVQVGAKGFAALVVWARGLEDERVWAIEDCRHVSGSFERFLIGRGERVLRVTTRLMAASRRNVRDRGKSDSIDAIAVARAALREGLNTLPAAQLEGRELDLRLLVDHRERLIRQRVALNNTLQWHLHDIWPELQLPGSSLFYGNWGPRIARRLARAEQTMRVRIARDELRRIRELSQTIKALQREIAQLVATIAPQLLTEPGFGPLIAAKLVGEVAGAARFATDAKLARAAGGRPDPGQFRQDQPAPPGPRRQPPDQRRDSSRRRHTPALPPRDPGLHRPQTRRRQEHQRRHPLPQTPPRPPRLAPAPTAPTRARNTAITISFLT
jgi:transposase